MNQSQFAKLHAVSAKTVTMWKNAGWLVFAGKEVDVDQSNANLQRYRTKGIKDFTQTPKGKGQGKETGGAAHASVEVKVQEGETATQAAERILMSVGADMDMDEAKRVKENYLALLSQLEYDQAAGLVVAVADVGKVVGEEYAKVRNRLLAIPSEHAPRLHRLKTVQEMQDMLHNVIVDVLEELVRDGAGRTS